MLLLVYFSTTLNRKYLAQYLKLYVRGVAKKNSKVYKLHDKYDDVKFIKHGTLGWAGHVMRMEESDPAKMLCTKLGGNGDRMRGRPKLRWCDELRG
jgi:hypothetical protein